MDACVVPEDLSTQTASVSTVALWLHTTANSISGSTDVGDMDVAVDLVATDLKVDDLMTTNLEVFGMADLTALSDDFLLGLGFPDNLILSLGVFGLDDLLSDEVFSPSLQPLYLTC